MNGGFTLSLNKRTKPGKRDGKNDSKKRKRQNVFGDEEAVVRTKIKLTHVEEGEKPEKPVIKPERLVSSLAEVQKIKEESEVKFGLIESSAEAGQKLPPNESKLLNSKSQWSDQVPDITTEEEYEAVPVENFGEAMLRGMGWDSGEEEGNSNDTKKKKLPHEMAKPLYMGIGAKIRTKDRAHRKLNDDSFLPVIKVERSNGEQTNS